MTVSSLTIKSLIGGVSQQPASIRDPSQCELAENCYMPPVRGVIKRPPTKHLTQIFSGATHSTDYVHTINRSLTERYTVHIANGSLAVYSLLDGSSRTINYPQGTAYLTATNPQQQFTALTVADYTFIVNKTIPVARSGSLTSVRNHEALVHVRQGSYSCEYAIFINGVLCAGFQTNNGGTASDSATVQTDFIAQNLYSQLVSTTYTSGHSGTNGYAESAASIAIMANFNVSVVGSTIYLQAKSAGYNFSLITTDGQGDTALIPVKDTIQAFSSLPLQAVDGFTVKVAGDSSNAFDDYYVKYNAPSGTSGSNGTWTECTAQGVDNGFNPATLPWQLTRDSNGTSFTFSQVGWTNRTCGDDTTTPPPSFIGKTINDVFFTRDRLGFLSDENVIMSKLGYFFTFWPDTATQVLDTDRIDVAVTHTKVSTLNAAATYANDLYLFSDQTQFILSGGDLLTPKSITVKPATEYENSTLTCKPISSSRHIFFPLLRGSFTGIRMINTLPVSNTIDATEMTQHVPSYIAGNVFKITTSSNEDVLACLESTNRNILYTYKWLWDQDRLVQSSWSKWVFDSGDTILNADFISTDLYLTIQRSDGVYIEVCSIETDRVDSGFTYQINLDRRLYQTGVYSSSTGLTTWTLPYLNTGGVFQVICGPSFTSPAKVGDVIPTSAILNSNLITAVGDFTAGACYIGRQYTKRFRISQQYVRRLTFQGAGPSNAEGVLKINRYSIGYQNSGYFRAEVTPYARPTMAYPFTALTAGSAGSTYGHHPVSTGTFRFPVMSDSRTVQVDLVNDSYLPSAFQQASWEAKYYIRSQPLQ